MQKNKNLELVTDEFLSNSEIIEINKTNAKKYTKNKAFKELKEDDFGIYEEVTNKESGEKERRHITNFIIDEIHTFSNADLTDKNFVTVVINGEPIKVETKIFNDVKRFKDSICNKMNYTFNGDNSDLARLKIHLYTNKLKSEKTLYNVAGFRKINNELIYMSNHGILHSDGTFDTMSSVERDTFNTTDFSDLDIITSDELKELLPNLFGFNSEEIVFPILGGTLATHFASFLSDSKIYDNLHVLNPVGESQSGKSATVERVIKPLLNIKYDSISCKGITYPNAFRLMSESYTQPVIFDEYTINNNGLSKDDVSIMDNIIKSSFSNFSEYRIIDNVQHAFKFKAPVILIGENTLNNTSSQNRALSVMFSKDSLTDEHLEPFIYLSKNQKLIEKLGYTFKRQILKKYQDLETLEHDLEMIENSLKDFYKLSNREFSTLKNCVFAISVLDEIIKEICNSKKGIDEYKNIRKITDIIYQTLSAQEENNDADYIKMLKRIDFAIGQGIITRESEFNFSQAKDVVYLSVSDIFSLLETNNYFPKDVSMTFREFNKKIKKNEKLFHAYDKAKIKNEKAQKKCMQLKTRYLSDLELYYLSGEMK